MGCKPLSVFLFLCFTGISKEIDKCDEGYISLNQSGLKGRIIPSNISKIPQPLFPGIDFFSNTHTQYYTSLSFFLPLAYSLSLSLSVYLAVPIINSSTRFSKAEYSSEVLPVLLLPEYSSDPPALLLATQPKAKAP